MVTAEKPPGAPFVALARRGVRVQATRTPHSRVTVYPQGAVIPDGVLSEADVLFMWRNGMIGAASAEQVAAAAKLAADNAAAERAAEEAAAKAAADRAALDKAAADTEAKALPAPPVPGRESVEAA
jgi:hypothetical protein